MPPVNIPPPDPDRLIPRACLEEKPTKQTVFFSGAYINMHAIQRAQGIDLGLISRVFSGLRPPTLNTAKKLSAALGMGLEAFLEALEIRKELLLDRDTRLKMQHTRRVQQEFRTDMRNARAGRPVKARLPGLSA